MNDKKSPSRLVLTRRVNEAVVIGGNLTVTVTNINQQTQRVSVCVTSKAQRLRATLTVNEKLYLTNDVTLIIKRINLSQARLMFSTVTDVPILREELLARSKHHEG